MSGVTLVDGQRIDRPVRRLSAAQARRCEEGIHPRCRCRCGGVYHGTKRSALVEFYEDLPDGDPHQIPQKSRQLRLPAPVGSDEAA